MRKAILFMLLGLFLNSINAVAAETIGEKDIIKAIQDCALADCNKLIDIIEKDFLGSYFEGIDISLMSLSYEYDMPRGWVYEDEDLRTCQREIENDKEAIWAVLDPQVIKPLSALYASNERIKDAVDKFSLRSDKFHNIGWLISKILTKY